MDRFTFQEGSSGAIAGDIVDRNGDAVSFASLTDARLTLYDLDTFVNTSPVEGIINGRHWQNVLNLADVTIDTDGHFEWSIQPDDNEIQTERRQVERHRAIFKFTWADGEFLYECELDVYNSPGAP